MTRYGYHAQHEQFDPRTLLRCVQLAEASGFVSVSASDHFHPWNERPGNSAFLWSWLGAAMETTSLTFRTVSAPGYRYHPAILAQAGATLSFMYPERLAMALGSGERINEAITGLVWPTKQDRNARLRECADIIRALWRGERVTHHGSVVVEEAKLYTLPEKPPLLIGAATSPETARWLGLWADGVITLAGGPPEKLRQIVTAFREGGGDGKPVLAQAKLAWGKDETKIRADAFEQWSTNLIAGDSVWELRTPRQFQEVAAIVKPEALDASVRVSADLAQHAAWLDEYVRAGVDELYLHNVATNQEEFIEAFGAEVLPQLY